MSPSRAPTPADVLAICLGAALVGASFALFWGGPAGAAHTVRIHAGNAEPLELPLDEARTVDVEGFAGQARIEIADGRVRIADSACRRKLCVHRGWLEAAGEYAICMPNGLSIEVGGDARGYDAFNF